MACSERRVRRRRCPGVMTKHMIIENWILENNLKPLMEMLSHWAKYTFEPDDWDAIHYGIQESNRETNKWFDYILSGVEPVSIRLAADPGSSVVHVRIECSPSLAAKAGVALELMQNYKLSR